MAGASDGRCKERPGDPAGIPHARVGSRRVQASFWTMSGSTPQSPTPGGGLRRGSALLGLMAVGLPGSTPQPCPDPHHNPVRIHITTLSGSTSQPCPDPHHNPLRIHITTLSGSTPQTLSGSTPQTLSGSSSCNHRRGRMLKRQAVDPCLGGILLTPDPDWCSGPSEVYPNCTGDMGLSQV